MGNGNPLELLDATSIGWLTVGDFSDPNPDHVVLARDESGTRNDSPYHELQDRSVLITAMANGIVRMARTNTPSTAAIEMVRKLQSNGLFRSIDELLQELIDQELPERLLVALLVATLPCSNMLLRRSSFAQYALKSIKSNEHSEISAIDLEKIL